MMTQTSPVGKDQGRLLRNEMIEIRDGNSRPVDLSKLGPLTVSDLANYSISLSGYNVDFKVSRTGRFVVSTIFIGKDVIFSGVFKSLDPALEALELMLKDNIRFLRSPDQTLQ